MGALARFSLGRRALVALVTVFIAVFGVLSAGQLKRELIPPLELPVISVSTLYPGASPEVVDAQVGEPLETALQAVEGLESSRSTSQSGFNAVQLEFAYGTDLNRARSQVDRVVANLGPQLPEEAETSSFAGSVSDFPVVFLALSGDEDLNTLRRRAEDVLAPRLQKIDGVRGADVLGGTDENVSVVPDPAALAAAGLTTSDITDALEENAGLFPVGQVTEGATTYPVQAGAAVEDLEGLRGIVVAPSGDGEPRTLDEVADVTLVAAAPTSLTRTDGVPTLSVSVTATPDADLVAVSQAVRDALPELASLVGGGADLTVVFDQAPFIQQSIDTLFQEGLLGLAFAVLVIAVFLLSVRSTLVTAVSIPLSLLAALIGVAAFGYSLNTLTLGALTISIGRVVDDAIVVVENIRRHLGLGADRRTAILDGTREVATAITASTLVSVAVFLPIAFVGGLDGRPITAERRSGYLEVLEEQGIAPLVIGGASSRGWGLNVAAPRIVADPSIDAVLAFNDLVMLGLMAGLARAGRMPGRDIRLVGFDDIEECAQVWPDLSSVSCDIAKFGRDVAATLLDWLREGRHPPPERREGVTLVPRRSSLGVTA